MQFCTFRVGDLFLGIEVSQVQEVLRFQPMTRVPLAPPAIRGLVNLRGQIIVALDLRRRLSLPDAPPDVQPVNVIVRTVDGAVSLLVDEVEDVISLGDDAFERPPETLQGPIRELIRGVYKLERRLMVALDAEKTIAVVPAGNAFTSDSHGG